MVMLAFVLPGIHPRLAPLRRRVLPAFIHGESDGEFGIVTKRSMSCNIALMMWHIAADSEVIDLHEVVFDLAQSWPGRGLKLRVRRGSDV